MDATLNQTVVFVDGDQARDAVVTRIYGDERSHVNLRYFDEAYVDPEPDPKPDDWAPGEPRADFVNVSAVPHAASAGESERSWRVTQPETPKKTPAKKEAESAPPTDPPTP